MACLKCSQPLLICLSDVYNGFREPVNFKLDLLQVEHIYKKVFSKISYLML